jgi:cytochrome c
MIVSYLKAQPVPNIVPTTSYEDLGTNTTTTTNTPPTPAAPQRPPVTGVEATLAKYGCMACHAVEKKGVGPAFTEIAAKYRANAGAADYLGKQVKNGSAGVWGKIPMPAHPDVSKTDLDVMVGWILTSK